MLGKLTIDAVPYHEPIIMVALGGGGLLGLLIAAAITKYKLWGYLWKEWFTSVDHKRIGVMYIIVALVMLLRGFADAAMMRTSRRWSATVAKVCFLRITTTRSLPRMA